MLPSPVISLNILITYFEMSARLYSCKGTKIKGGVFYMRGWNRVREISMCPRSGDSLGFHREHEFSSSGFTSTLPTWADSSRVTQAVRQVASPLSWLQLQLSVRIFAEPYWRRHLSFPGPSVSVDRGWNYPQGMKMCQHFYMKINIFPKS